MRQARLLEDGLGVRVRREVVADGLEQLVDRGCQIMRVSTLEYPCEYPGVPQCGGGRARAAC